jgi:glycosyltransferase involved in cell wall biosynthesis
MRRKIIRITTIAASLDTLLKGQLRFLNAYYDVMGVASGKEELELIKKREGIRVFNVEMKREICLFRDLLSLLSLIVLFLKEKPYIVHANTPKGSLLAMVTAWVTRVPHRIYTVTGLRFETATGNFRYLLITMERVTCWCSTKVIPEGNGVKQTLLKEGITNKPLNVVLNGNINGIDIEYFKQSDEIKQQALLIAEENKFTFCFVGRMVRDKGINELVYAFTHLNKKYADTRLLLVGSFEDDLDPLNPDVKEIIVNHPSIDYVGHQKDIRPYLAASDALVFPSYREGFPNVVLQAGAMGLPSIVTDISGCNEIIEEGTNGVIIPPKDKEALLNSMEYFVEHRGDTVLEMGQRARPVIVERFEQSKVWDALLKEYKSLD